MRNIHPAVWCGLVLNFIVIYAVLFAFNMPEFSEIAAQQGLQQAEIEEVIDGTRVIMYGLLLIQGVAVALIVSRNRLGFILAVCSSVLLAPPLSLLYLMGCALTDARVKFAGFPKAPKRPEQLGKPLYAFRPLAARRTRNTMFAMMGMSALAVVSGWLSAALTLFGVTLCLIYMAIRTAGRPALALYNEGFTLLPSLFADCIALPYTAITQATLLDNGSIHFQITLNDRRKVLVWSQASVEPAERQTALEELGSALAAHDVPLA